MDYLTGNEVAALLGVSRKTVYRWVDLERIPPQSAWRYDILKHYAGLGKLPKGPPRRRSSLRYTVYRHRFDEVR